MNIVFYHAATFIIVMLAALIVCFWQYSDRHAQEKGDAECRVSQKLQSCFY